MTAEWSIDSGPGLTALGLAAARSVETGRPDRLIEDRFARQLFCSIDSGLPMLVDWPSADQPLSDAEKLHLHGSRYIGLRTRFYDDSLLAAADAGLRQAVLLGAGLDTRAFRLELPGDLHLFELDQPGVLAYKDEILQRDDAAPRCTRTIVCADLRGDWPAALRGSGFHPGRATAWIAEGLLPYLDWAAQTNLIGSVAALSGSGSCLVFDNIQGDPRADGRLRTLSERSGMDMTSLMAGGTPPNLGPTLTERGWTVTEQTTAALAHRHSRDLSDPFSTKGTAAPAEPPWLATTFVSATLSNHDGS